MEITREIAKFGNKNVPLSQCGYYIHIYYFCFRFVASTSRYGPLLMPPSTDKEDYSSKKQFKN